MENRGRFLSWNDKKKLTKILKFFQVNTRQWNGWFVIKQLSVIYAICAEYTTKLNTILKCRSRWERSTRLPVGKSFLLLFAYEKGLGHM